MTGLGELDINEYVWVKLTDIGRKAHADHWRQYAERLKCEVPIHTDTEGWSRFQLWELMNIFGPMMFMTADLPFETTIRITPTAAP